MRPRARALDHALPAVRSMTLSQGSMRCSFHLHILIRAWPYRLASPDAVLAFARLTLQI